MRGEKLGNEELKRRLSAAEAALETLRRERAKNAGRGSLRQLLLKTTGVSLNEQLESKG